MQNHKLICYASNLRNECKFGVKILTNLKQLVLSQEPVPLVEALARECEPRAQVAVAQVAQERQ